MHSFLRTQNTNIKGLMKLWEVLLSHMTIIFFLMTGKKYLFRFSIKFSASFSFYVNSKKLFMLLQDCVFFSNAEFVLRLYINEGVLESSQPDFEKSDQNIKIFCLGWQLFSISHNGIINSIPCNVSSNKQINILTVLIILRIF